MDISQESPSLMSDFNLLLSLTARSVYGKDSADRIRTVTLGSNFTVRIFCQVRFCRCKISGLELVFSVVDLDFKAVA